MKKLIALLLAAAMPLSLAACGGQEANDAPPAQADSAPVASSASSTPAASAPENEPAPAPEPAIEALALGTPYATEDYEVTFNEVYMTKKCEVSTGSHSTTYQEASEGNTFLVLNTTLKNLATETMDTWSAKDTLFKAYAMYNDKYKYEQGSIIVGDKDIEPLAAKTECFTIEIPDTVADAAEPLVIYVNIDGTTYQYKVR